MLGVRARWHAGGRESAERAFFSFRSVILQAIQTQKRGKIIQGGIEADSAAIICTSLGTAINIGRNAFRFAFCTAKKSRDERMWLRGVIVPAGEIDKLRVEQPLEDFEQILISDYSPSLLEAISAEKSGFKGMRLLVGGGITNSMLLKTHRLKIFDKSICPMIRLRSPSYPSRLKEGYRDILWMASETETQWDEMKSHMQNRLRWAASNADELMHAAITHVVFNRCGIFLGAIKNQLATVNDTHA